MASRKSATLDGPAHYYVVTNQHVFCDSPESRFNKVGGGVEFVCADQVDWLMKSNFDDIAVFDITDHLDFRRYEVASIPEDEFLQKQQSFFEMGDDVFMVGPFVNEPGTDRNVPNARFGNISGMADDCELIEQPHHVLRPTHIVDLRSRTGFSGSPVFVYDTPHHIWTHDRWTLRWNHSGLLKLFGAHCGQYPDIVEAHIVATRTKQKIKIPSSMNLIVPTWRISELLDDPKLERLHRQRDEHRRDKYEKMAKPESLASEDLPVEEGAERRCDGVLRRMLNTPPHPRTGKATGKVERGPRTGHRDSGSRKRG